MAEETLGLADAVDCVCVPREHEAVALSVSVWLRGVSVRDKVTVAVMEGGDGVLVLVSVRLEVRRRLKERVAD